VARNFWRAIRQPLNAEKTDKLNKKQPGGFFSAAGVVVLKLELSIIVPRLLGRLLVSRFPVLRDDVFPFPFGPG
jgi:hypothetical protein